MNCDRVARIYRWIEYAAFGRRLQKHRLYFLSAAHHSRRALLLGDGDGRFLYAFARFNSHAEIDSVELSEQMIEVAQKRLRKLRKFVGRSNVNWIRGDACTASLPPSEYDLIVTNFFLDCFLNADVELLAKNIRASSKPGTQWIVSEFRKPAEGWRAWHASLWLRTMYLFFRLATDLKTQQLPDYRPTLSSVGFALAAEKSSFAGLIVSELWVLTESSATERSSEA